MAKKKYTNKVKDSVIYLYPNEYGLGGDILGGIKSGIGSSIAGTAVNLGLKGLGALGKAAFGSQINQDKVNEINAINDALNTLRIDASTNESVLGQWGNQSFGLDFTQKDIGHDGWFRNKAKRTYNRLLDETASAEESVLNSYDNAIANVDINNDLNALSNFVAYGGPIHIKKENRGAFTKYCGGEVTQACINKGKNSPNPLTRKRANFADVARKWHAAGGPINMITDAPMSPFGNRFNDGSWMNTAKTAASFLPVVGTLTDAYDFYKDPSLENLGWLGASIASDIFTGGSTKAALRAAKLARASQKIAKVRNAKRIESALHRGNKAWKSNLSAARKANNIAKEYEKDFYKNIGDIVINQSIDSGLNTIQQNTNAFGGNLMAYGGYLEGQTYDIDESELELLKDLGYEYEIID